ncbi:MAG: hypothetical protein HY841_03350 [Bacteroidetes bacterium]|nr:hypothetical protein [Bacteroidota bacterium]
MNKLFLASLLAALSCGHLLAQKKDTILQQDDLLSSLIADSSHPQKLLPDHIIFTQRILWGQKGLMRNFNAFELTPVNRAHELKVRRTMLVCHQVMGGITSLGMIGQAIVGAKLYNGDRSMKDLHEGLGAGVNIGYFSTAAFSLFAPPKMINERKGYSSIKVHKWLALIHMSGMIATNILAGQLEGHPELRKWHRAAAYTAFGVFIAAEGVIKF